MPPSVCFYCVLFVTFYFKSAAFKIMLFQSLLTGLSLATALKATPLRKDESLRGVVHFRRDAILSARDLELADMHGVNLTESESTEDYRHNITPLAMDTDLSRSGVVWKHSIHKRHDGDDVTIWVDSNYEVTQGPKNSISKRQSAHLWPSAHYEAAISGKIAGPAADLTSLDLHHLSPVVSSLSAIRPWTVMDISSLAQTLRITISGDLVREAGVGGPF
jgi:hypothetical protein